jgi:4-amino-4-deoxy-L-arabinose transferase-like glycosyltransferase
MTLVLTYFFVSFSILLISFIPGYLFLRALTPIKEEEAIAASFGISFLFFYILSFSAFLLKTDFAILCLIVSTFLFTYIKYQKKPIGIEKRETKILLFLFLIFFFHLVSMQAVTPVYTGGFWYRDWIVHYGKSEFYLDGEIVEYISERAITSRPALFNILGAFFFSIFGRDFWIFQIFSSLASSVFILGSYLVAKKLLGSDAMLLPILIFLSPFFLRNALFTWPKLLATYFILLSFYYYLQLRGTEFRVSTELILFGIFSGLAILSHQFSMMYIGVLLLDALLVRRRSGISISSRGGVTFFCIAFFILAPWYLWASYTFGPQIFLANPSVKEGFSFLQLPILFSMNLLLSLIPAELFYYLTRFLSDPFINHELLFGAVYAVLPSDVHPPAVFVYHEKIFDSLLSYYFSTFPGAITTTLAFFMFHEFKKRRGFGVGSLLRFLKGRIKSDYLFATPGGLVLLTFLLTYIGLSIAAPYPTGHGIVGAALVPSVVLLLIYAIKYMENLPRKLMIIICFFLFLEFIFIAWMQPFYILSGLRDLTFDGNYRLKVTYGIIYAWDYMGGGVVLFALICILAEIFFIILMYRALTRLQEFIS